MRYFLSLFVAGILLAASLAPAAEATPLADPAGVTALTAANSELIEKTAFVWGGRTYCWYDGGWRGAGWYWCGYAWRRGFGWGGPRGWRGWHWHGWRRGGHWGHHRGHAHWRGHRGGWHGHRGGHRGGHWGGHRGGHHGGHRGGHRGGHHGRR